MRGSIPFVLLAGQCAAFRAPPSAAQPSASPAAITGSQPQPHAVSTRLATSPRGLPIFSASAAAAASGLPALLPPSAARAVDDISGVATDADINAALSTFEPRGITPEDTVIFVLGCIPFVYAGIEFWTRIANGDSFGTGRDSVVIQPLGQQYEGNKRVLGADALIAARILFGIAGASAVLVLVAGVDILKG